MRENDEFDRLFNKTLNQVQGAQKVAAMIIVGNILVGLTVLGLITWAAVHFISKFW